MRKAWRFTHWVMWNIAIDGNIPEDFKGAEQVNGAKNRDIPACARQAERIHYHFKCIALDTQLTLDKHR